MKRVLVTGGTGLIGRLVVEKLAGRGFEVHVLARRRPRSVLPARVWEGDLLAPGQAGAIVESVRPGHLVHLAWTTEAGRFWDDPANDSWADASIELHRAFAAAGGGRALHAGSCAEYAWNDEPLDDAKTPLRPASRYGQAKDRLRRAVEADRTISSAWARIFFLYGPGQQRGRLVADAAVALTQGQPTPAPLALDRRDYLHVEDVADALVAILEHGHDGPINVASGDAVAMGGMMELMARIAGRPDLARSTPESAERRASRVVGSVSKLRHAVGFTPRWSLEEGLRQTLAWWQDRPLHTAIPADQSS